MRTNIGCVAVLLGMMGIVTGAAAVGKNNAGLAGKRGLSPMSPLNANPQTALVSGSPACARRPELHRRHWLRRSGFPSG